MNNYQTIIGPTVEDLIKSNYKVENLMDFPGH